MIDKEKVIRAVDSCFDYWLEQHRCLQPLEQEAVRQLKADALAMLKKQEPKPMIEVEDDDIYAWSPEDVSYYCPECEKELSYNYNFCPYCGQAVK